MKYTAHVEIDRDCSFASLPRIFLELVQDRSIQAQHYVTI